MIIIGFIITFVIGIFVGITIISLMKTAKVVDLQIILLQLMDKLKKDRKAAQLEMARGENHSINYGKYDQANRTIELIEKLYGGIS